MYQIKCDNYILYDPRSDELVVNSARCKLKENTVGEASFSIFETHPFYNRLRKLKSVFEILQDGQPIFRGRMTDDTRDFDNVKVVDLEGAMSYFNDSVIRPFSFPDDFANNDDYKAAARTGNVIQFFLNWLIEQHNAQVDEFQRFKLGKVTVADSNNYLSRAAADYASTWETLKSKLFDSALGGYLCIRYEADGNYIDYLADFELTNVQRVEYGKNLLDITMNSDAAPSFSAVIPRGAKLNEIDKESSDDSRLTISELPDGKVTDDIVKVGDMLYSISARERFGFILANPSDTVWEDVTLPRNLRDKGVELITTKGMMLTDTIEIQARDLHFSDEAVEAFRIYRYIYVKSKPHEHEDLYRLTELDIDILNPQDTNLTLGDTRLSMTDINAGIKQDIANSSVVIKSEVRSEVTSQVEQSRTEILTSCEEIIVSALTDYVETGDFNEYRETVVSQLSFLAEQMNLQFTETTSRIEEVDGDLQEKFNTITKYFTFDINGLTIGQTDNPNKVVIDNDEISILVNGVVVQKFDAEGHALIPELTVTNKMNLFGYLIDQDSAGRVNCEYAGV